MIILAKPLLRGQRSRGFTLIEVMLALLITALLSAIAVPSYQAVVERARSAQAVADITELGLQLERFRTTNFRLPADLGELGVAVPQDPWGNAYAYLNIEGGGPGARGAARKDKNLVPINTDFDLYSAGRDGRTAAPLPSRWARDDIVRAANGGFIGKAEDY
jgi:general secretion pathway protein G